MKIITVTVHFVGADLCVGPVGAFIIRGGWGDVGIAPYDIVMTYL